jgi:hypothetical protein
MAFNLHKKINYANLDGDLTSYFNTSIVSALIENPCSLGHEISSDTWAVGSNPTSGTDVWWHFFVFVFFVGSCQEFYHLSVRSIVPD